MMISARNCAGRVRRGETDYSELLCQRCPDSAAKIYRVDNGIDLGRFPDPPSATANSTPRILSVGRLVAFKGFEQLIRACAELARRGVDFTCEIIGDGPLRDNLQAEIDKLSVSSRVTLLGSLSQGAVFDKLRAADIFALASVMDRQGASDVFPTVIIEAMAAARPVVSTQLAGIPESVEHRQTGLLVPPGDTIALIDALERLIRDSELRLQYGRAGRTRIEEHFRIEQTVAPLLQLLKNASVAPSKPKAPLVTHQIAYLIDRWPDEDLPLLERELQEMQRRNISIIPFVCELDSAARLTRKVFQMAVAGILPDDGDEAQNGAHHTLAQKLEEERAQETERLPGGIFLRQARFALVLRRLLVEKKVSHVHATSSRALACALILQKLVDVTVSATIEPRPELSQQWIEKALRRCEGGRLSDRKLFPDRDGSFLVGKAALHSVPRKALQSFGERIGIDLTGGASFWQEWSELLVRFSRGKAPSKSKTSE
jgi:hypothetical protein